MSKSKRNRLTQPSADELGMAIRALRVERQLKLEKLATVSGIHWTYLSGIERGVRNPTWKVLTSIAQSLEIRISELVRRAEDAAAAR